MSIPLTYVSLAEINILQIILAQFGAWFSSPSILLPFPQLLLLGVLCPSQRHFWAQVSFSPESCGS